MNAKITTKILVSTLVLATFAGIPTAAASAPAVSAIDVSNAAFSPNGDGQKDTTTVTVTLASAYSGSLYANVYDGNGALVRTGIPLAGSGLVWSAAWDGKNDVEATVAQGVYTVRATGNNYGGSADVDTAASTSVTVDVAAPTGLSILIQGTDSENRFTSSATVNMVLAATGATQMSFREGSSGAYSTWETFGTTRAFTLSATQEEKTVWFRARDDAGNVGTPVSASIILDTSAPTNGRVLVENNDREYTTSTTVNLTVQGTGASQMRLSNDAGSTWGAWQAFATSVSGYSLASGVADGVVFVAIQLRDEAGNLATGTSDSITLDRVAPTISTSPSSSDVTSSEATIAWQTSEASASYVEYGTSQTGPYTSNSGWLAPQGTTAHSVRLTSLAPGTTYYYIVKSRDLAGNVVSATTASSFQTSSTVSNAPRDLTVAINGGALYTNSPEVTLTLAGTEAAESSFSNSAASDSVWSAWGTFTTSQSWNLTTTATGGVDADGLKRVYFRARNTIGTSASNAEATITLDRVAPDVSRTGEASLGWASAAPTLGFTASDTVGLASVEYRITTGAAGSGTSLVPWTALGGVSGTSHAASLVPSAGALAQGIHHVSVRATDLAGNVLTSEDLFDFGYDTGAPVAGTLSATARTAGADLSWTAATDASTLTYQVQRATSEDGPFENLGAALSSGQLSYTTPTLPEAVTYFRVRATDAAGNTAYTNVVPADLRAPTPGDEGTDGDGADTGDTDTGGSNTGSDTGDTDTGGSNTGSNTGSTNTGDAGSGNGTGAQTGDQETPADDLDDPDATSQVDLDTGTGEDTAGSGTREDPSTDDDATPSGEDDSAGRTGGDEGAEDDAEATPTVPTPTPTPTPTPKPTPAKSRGFIPGFEGGLFVLAGVAAALLVARRRA